MGEEQNHSQPALPFPFEVAQQLIQTYGSPLYVYNGDRLEKTIDLITAAISYPDTHFHFASVTNGSISLLQIFRNKGWGLHANTPGDIYLGLQAGFPPQEIVYSGSNLSGEEMQQVLCWGVNCLNLDSLSQLKLCCETYHHLPARTPLRLGLRLNIPVLTGESRIGVLPEELTAAQEIVTQFGLKLQGLHFYRGTGTIATEAFTKIIPTLLTIGESLPDWKYLDFGGGFGYPYRPQQLPFDWSNFGQQLQQALQTCQHQIQLLIEPGRAAIAGCATLLTKVVSVKSQGEKQLVGVDTTIANLTVPAVHGGYRQIVTWPQQEGQLYTSDVCGNTTYSRDYLGRNCQLPALKVGDILGILDVGAYGYAMSSHFLHRLRPAEVLLTAQGNKLIREREDYSLLLQNQVFEGE